MPEKDRESERPAAEPAGLGQLADVIERALNRATDAAKPKYRDNPNYVADTVFNPAGVQKALQTRRYFWNGAEIDWNQITPPEAELLEALKVGQYHQVARPNPTGGPERRVAQWIVRHRASGDENELFIEFPASDADQRASLPSMKAMLMEMVLGQPAP